MTIQDILVFAGTIITTFGGGALLVLALSKWLGGLWASRILKSEEFRLQLEQDLVTRRRDIYSRLATALRVFLRGTTPSTEKEKAEFLQAHDEAFLWASESVAAAIGEFLDLQVAIKANNGSISMEEMQKMQQSIRRCLKEMRKDVGFSNTGADYRIVSF